VPQNRFKAGLMIGINDLTPIIAYERGKFTYLGGYDLMGAEKGIRLGVLYNIK